MYVQTKAFRMLTVIDEFTRECLAIAVDRHIRSGDVLQNLKNRILLENYYLPGHIETSIAAFVERCNHRRYHESLGNLTPVDVYLGRATAILDRRRRIKDQIIRKRRLAHRRQAT